MEDLIFLSIQTKSKIEKEKRIQTSSMISEENKIDR